MSLTPLPGNPSQALVPERMHGAHDPCERPLRGNCNSRPKGVKLVVRGGARRAVGKRGSYPLVARDATWSGQQGRSKEAVLPSRSPISLSLKSRI